MQLRLRAPIGALVLTALIATVSCPVAAQTAPIPLRVAATANDTYAEAYYAQDLGYFAKAGLDVQLTTFANGASVAQGVAGGAVDIGVSNVVQIAGAVEHNVPFELIAGGGLYSTDAATSELLVANDAPIKVAKDFEGKTIAVSTLKDLSAVAVQAWLTGNGADVTKISFVEVPFSAMGDSLARGTVAGAVISEPSLSMARTNGARVFAKPYDAIGKHFMISGWFTTSGFAKKNPDAVKRFTQAIVEAGRWATTHHAESAAILVKYAKLKPEMAAKMTRCGYAETLDPKLIQPAIDLAAHVHMIDHAIPASDLSAK